MNTKQEHLLQILKEVDHLCKENGITYYCAAGTVLGAIRHGGFIPWDDDIDILMTRDQFLRFVRVLKAGDIPDRTVVYFEGNHEHHSTVARYITTDSTMFCHHHITGYAPAGISIDIFILDPVPDDHNALVDHIARFFAYSDLVAPTLSHSNRLPSKYATIADGYLKTAEQRSVYEVAEELSGNLFSIDDSSCRNYMLRWGSQPFMYPKEFFGSPSFMKFEDMDIPVPEKWPQYLSTHYGFEWMDIPIVESREQHVTVFDPGRDFHEIYSIRDNIYDQSQLYKLHRDMQAARRRSDAYLHIHEEYSADLQIRLCEKEIEKGYEAAGLPYSPLRVAGDLVRSKQYEVLTGIYAPYIKLQTSKAFMGSRGHGSYYHILFPIIVPIDPELLIMLLMAMVRSGKENDALKITGIYQNAGLEIEGLDEIKYILDNISTVFGLYYSGEYKRALEVIDQTDNYAEIPSLRNYRWLSLIHTDMDPSQAEQLRELAVRDDAPVELKKAYGDMLYNRCCASDAEDFYTSLLRRTRNGMFLSDIRSKGYSVDENNLSDMHKRDKSEVLLRAEVLANELSELCHRHDIDLIIRDVSDGRHEFFITASSVNRFMNEIGNDLPPCRKIFSWKNGDAVKTFDILYADTSTIDCDIRYDADPSCCYVSLRVHIIRRAPIGRILRVQERSVRQMDRSMFSLGRISSEVKINSFSKTSGLADWKKRKYRQKVFAALLRKESRAVGPVSEKDIERNLKKAYSRTNPSGSIFVMQSTVTSYDDIFTNNDKDTYRGLPWYEYGIAVTKTTEASIEVEHVWKKLQTAAL